MPKKIHDIHDAIKRENPKMKDNSAWAIAQGQLNKMKAKKKAKSKEDLPNGKATQPMVSKKTLPLVFGKGKTGQLGKGLNKGQARRQEY